VAVLPSRTNQRLLAEARLMECFRTRPMRAESMRQLFLEDTVHALSR